MDIKLSGILSTSTGQSSTIALTCYTFSAPQDGTIGMDIKLTGILSTSFT
jgi:hypothetical protein